MMNTQPPEIPTDTVTLPLPPGHAFFFESNHQSSISDRKRRKKESDIQYPW
jgi:hypothetical protein